LVRDHGRTCLGVPVWLLQQASGSGNGSEARPRSLHTRLMECADGLAGQIFVVTGQKFLWLACNRINKNYYDISISWIALLAQLTS
jgi:hypothetical protein